MDKCCINCSNFAWWDGDYCCVKKFEILQPSPDGEFTKEIFPILEINKECIDYELSDDNNTYIEAFEEFIKESPQE